MTTEIYPRGYAGTSADTVNRDTVLLDGPHNTLVFDMPIDTAVVQYEMVKLSASALAKIAGAPIAGDIVGIVVEAVDNLNATAANLRRSKAVVYVSGAFNETKIVMVASAIAAYKAVANGSGIRLKPVLAFSG